MAVRGGGWRKENEFFLLRFSFNPLLQLQYTSFYKLAVEQNAPFYRQI